MTTVIDSNIVAAIMLPLPYSSQAIAMMDFWHRTGEYLIAPMLFEYEIASLIRRSVLSRQLEPEQAAEAIDRLLGMELVTIPPTISLHKAAFQMAERIGQAKAYDAQYLALAARENAPLWTADRRLANAAHAAGLLWVNWVGDWKTSTGPVNSP